MQAGWDPEGSRGVGGSSDFIRAVLVFTTSPKGLTTTPRCHCIRELTMKKAKGESVLCLLPSL